MNNLKTLILGLVFCLSSCTVYTEKQSEAVSQNVYATKDSVDLARIDLADNYINEATKLIKPPKKRIEISGIYQQSTIKDSTDNKRIVIVPEKYKNDKVVVVGSADYDSLLKDKAVAAQLKKDNENILKAKQETEQELIKQAEMQNKMVQDLNIMQKKLIQKDLRILQLTVALISVLLIFATAIYLRIKGVL
jgi:superfamily I DNA and/or RNA helicase